ncbi:MAG: hypothetical protein DMF86_13120 [Acidobacteria bacterium]|nr:MAG: hypothetical protein DMF86_13120 [Acidobacteriota bacterium]
MSFATPLPVWATLVAVAAAAWLAWHAYRGAALPRHARAVLSTLRVVTLLVLLVCLMRPVARSTDADARDAVVAILVDGSRSMSIADVNGERRIDRARAILRDEVMPRVRATFHADVLRFGDQLAPADERTLSATDSRTRLGRALAGVRDRYRGRAVAGIILLSDGGDSGGEDAAAAASGGAPIYAIGVGSPSVERDREILSVTAAESVLSDAVVDVAVSAVSHGYGRAPIELRLLENGRSIDVRRAAPAGDGIPVREVFRVSPNREVPTVYTVETPAGPDELVPENNLRSALVPAAARARRVLLVEGAPGFEHGFLKRSLAADRGLEVDSVIRKGRDESGADTFYVQAARSRADALTAGYPASRDALFGYDVIVLANVEGELLTGAQLAMTRAFVADRGGGLLVLGARGFQRQSLRNTPIEDVLPLDLSDRTGGVVPASASPGMNRVALTAEGDAHPVMQLAPSSEENRRKWNDVPSLASISPLGAARPGAAVLAVTGGPGGTPRALVAVQRFGEGRAMVFTGEAAWRWRMMLPSSDPSYDRFWRQAVRWLGQAAPDPVAFVLPALSCTGDDVRVSVFARDAAFAPQPDAVVDVRVTRPDGRVDSVRAEPDPARPGVFEAPVGAAPAGVYRLTADARRGAIALGGASGSLLVGGGDEEMADPRLNEDVLQRVARASGGAVVSPASLGSVVERLRAHAPAAALSIRRDLWHTGWSFAAIALLLAAEWLLRRHWGLR